ncbi:MAG TPA: response regulator [Patescibacteria group bacterium]|nr:response regulator [Patescibacteria group bacterium]
MAKILIVDDDAVNTRLFVNKLTIDGHTVTYAEDGDTAMQHMSEPFNLIVLDIMVPRADGVTILKKLRAGVNKKTPVIVFTNLISDTVKAEAMEKGASEYLQKTDFTPQTFIAKIGEYISD